MQGLMLHAGAERIGRQELLALPVPDATDTHKPVAHSDLVAATIEALAYRKIEVVRDEYGITKDGMRMFGFLEVNIERDGHRLGIALRNANDKAFSIGLCAGWRTFVCDNLAFHSDFMAVTKRHTKHLDIPELMAVGVDKVQRQFEKLEQKIDAWAKFTLTDANARLLIYRAFVEDQLDAPKHLARIVHDHYFNPRYPEFEPRTLLSLNNAFTGAFKENLDPVPLHRATASLGTFLNVIH